MSLFIETIKIVDGRFYNLDYHQRRLSETSVAFFGKAPGWDLEEFLDRQKVPDDGFYKCRVTYGSDLVTVDFQPYTIKRVVTLKLVNGGGINYERKFADRRPLERLLRQKESSDDILILRDNMITDTSYANIVFADGEEEWYTPASPLLNGTMRQYLLESGRIREMPMGLKELDNFWKFKLVNAMLGWDAPESHISNIT